MLCFLSITLLFTDANEVCRGYRGFGALGHSVYRRELFPRLVKGFYEGTIKHIATSGTHTAAITESGLFFSWNFIPALFKTNFQLELEFGHFF